MRSSTSEAPGVSDEGGRLEATSARLLGWPIAALLAVLVAAQLATWIPHYLTWPWYTDHDVFGTLAMAWDAGVLPYRDLDSNNFPGTIYLLWVAGKLCGWGRPSCLFAIDASLVVALGAVLLAWSRRQCGRWLPGLVGYGAFLGYYLTLDYSQAAQRDWQGPFFAVAGLLIAQTWPGRGSALLSALAMSAALLFRPQTVLLAPALALASTEGIARPPWARARAIGVWVLAVSVFLATGFLPLISDGVWGDFVRAMRMLAVGGGYNRVSPLGFVGRLFAQLVPLKIVMVPIAICLLWRRVGVETQRTARVWMIALAGVLLYAPLGPIPHAYLAHPLVLVWAINVGVLAWVVLDARGLTPTLQLTMLGLILALVISVHPRFCNPRASLAAIAGWWRGEEPITQPMGYTTNIDVPAAAEYPWDDYRRTVDYLRRSTEPQMRLANALKLVPALTGPTARLPAFPAESVAWLTVVRKDDEGRFVDALRRNPNSVVVWAPSERDHPRLPKLALLIEAIESLYEFDRRFGMIEIWRRKRDAPPTQMNPPLAR